MASNSVNDINEGANGYTPVGGTFSVNENGYAVYTADSINSFAGEDKAAVNDIARYLGCVHGNGAEKIEYDGKEYVWNEDIATELNPANKPFEGSNWVSEEPKATLMSVVTDEVAENLKLGLVPVEIDVIIDSIPTKLIINMK